eukprot:4623185-Prorocentrum_lima.AAC.1
MSLTSVVIKIGNMQQGVAMHLYTRMFRWNGTHDIVDLMAGTNVLNVNGVTSRLLQTYRAFALLPDGVPVEHIWVVSPPCGGLRDVARDIRDSSQGSS